MGAPSVVRLAHLVRVIPGWQAGALHGSPDMPLFFLLRLVGPRPDFMHTMTDDERALMMRHGAYLKGWLDQGKIIVFGPVADPVGPWGMAVAQVESREELDAITNDDPTITSGQGFRYEALPMPRAVFRQ
jgi:uncharacterized protein